MMIYNIIFLAILVLVISGCSKSISVSALNGNAKDLYSEAEKLNEEGKKAEAVKVILMLEDLHPKDQDLSSLKEKVFDNVSDAQKSSLERNELLGFNKGYRSYDEESGIFEKIIWYIPDRFFDFVDILSVEVNVGPQFGAGVWATRAVQAKAFAGGTLGGGYYQKKQIGYRAETSFEYGLGPVGISTVAGARLGTGGFDSTLSNEFLAQPSDKIHQEYRDYWGVGGKIGFFYIGAEAEIHPIEIADFFAGIFMFDLLNDDLATTNRLKFSSRQSDLIEQYQDMLRELDDEEIEEYNKKFKKLL